MSTMKRRLIVSYIVAAILICTGIGLVVYCYNWNHVQYTRKFTSEFEMELLIGIFGKLPTEIEHGLEFGYYTAALIGTPACILLAAAAIIYAVKKEKIGAFICSRKTQIAERTAKKNKSFEEMTPSEQARHLRFLEQMYNHGDLSFIEYNTLKAKYTGEKSFVEQFGFEFTMAASDKLAADKAMQQHIDNAEKRIITNAAVGNAVGGLAGGVAFSVAAANRANAEAAQLHAQQEKANKRYEEALKNSVK